MKFSVAAILILATAVCACGTKSPDNPGNVSVDEHGACTQQFIDDFKAVTTAFDRLSPKDNPSPETVDAVKASCDKFRGTHGTGVTCRARDGVTLAKLTLESNRVYKACGMADQVISRSKIKTPALDDGDDSSSNLPACSSSFTNSANKAVAAITRLRDSMSDETIQKAKTLCAVFKRSYKRSYVCKVKGSNGATQAAKADDLYFACEKVNDVSP